MEIGKYYCRRGDYEAALTPLSAAYKGDPKSKEALRLLVDVNRKLNRHGQADYLEGLLKKEFDEPDDK